MVRKITVVIAALLLLCGFATGAQAATYSVYDGTMSSTQLTYFRDILPGIGLQDNYVAFRSGEREYRMVVGDLNYNGGVFTCNDVSTVYTITNDSSYNGRYRYSVTTIDSLNLSVGDNIIYSDLGHFPQLIERSSNYEIFTALLVAIGLFGFVVRSILFSSSRRYR